MLQSIFVILEILLGRIEIAWSYMNGKEMNPVLMSVRKNLFQIAGRKDFKYITLQGMAHISVAIRNTNHMPCVPYSKELI